MAVPLKNKTFTAIDTLLDFLEFSEENRALVSGDGPAFPSWYRAVWLKKWGRMTLHAPFFFSLFLFLKRRLLSSLLPLNP